MALLSRMLRGRRALALTAVSSSGLTAAVQLWWNWQLGGIIDLVGAGKSPGTNMILWALIAMALMGAAACAKGLLAGYACESLAHDLRMGYARHFAALPVAQAEQLSAGEQLSKLQNEIAGVSDYLNANLFQLVDSAVSFASTFVWLLFVNPALTLAANLPALAALAYVFWSSKLIGAAAERSQQAKGTMNQYADTLLSLFPVIRLYDGFRLTLDGYRAAVGAWEGCTSRMERTKARLMSLSGVLSSIPPLLLFLVGGHMAISGALTVGTLYIFLNLSGNISGALMNMPGFIAAFRQFSANMKRLAPNVSLAGKGDRA